MSMIDRYKKRGGFVQLVNLLETMGHEKREKYLGLIAAEDPNWEGAIKQKMLTLDRLSRWAPPFLMEFLPELPIPVLASAFNGMPEDKRQLLFTGLPFAIKKRVEDAMKERNSTPAEIASGQMKILNEARNFISQGKIKLDKCDPEMIIPEDIEDRLANYSYVVPSKETGDSASTTAHPAAVAAIAAAVGGTNANSQAIAEELVTLRRKVMALSQENQKLAKELNEYKFKIEAVKTALTKTAA